MEVEEVSRAADVSSASEELSVVVELDTGVELSSDAEVESEEVEASLSRVELSVLVSADVEVPTDDVEFPSVAELSSDIEELSVEEEVPLLVGVELSTAN